MYAANQCVHQWDVSLEDIVYWMRKGNFVSQPKTPEQLYAIGQLLGAEAEEERPDQPEEKTPDQEKGQGIARINRDRILRGLPPLRRKNRTPCRKKKGHEQEVGYDEHSPNLL
jgi:hypothetical protein